MCELLGSISNMKKEEKKEGMRGERERGTQNECSEAMPIEVALNPNLWAQ